MNQLTNKFLRRTFRKFAYFTCSGPVKDGAIFGNNTIEQLKSRKNFHEVVKFPAGHENQFAAGFLEIQKSINRALADTAVPSDGAVIVAGQGVISHNLKILQVTCGE